MTIAPRGHSVPVPGELGGAAMVIDLLLKRADELGVQFRYETGVTNLVTADDSVVGVAWKSFDRTGVVRTPAVIVAAGGFVMNPDMVAEHTPSLGSKLFTLGSTYDDGLGLRSAEFLVREHLPLERVLLIAVGNDRVRDRVRAALDAVGLRTRVAVYPPWFQPTADLPEE